MMNRMVMLLYDGERAWCFDGLVNSDTRRRLV